MHLYSNMLPLLAMLHEPGIGKAELAELLWRDGARLE